MYQSTIAKEIRFEGIGLHTGVYTKVKIIPAESNMGIVFKYLHNKDNYEIRADIDQVVGTKRGTTLGLNNEKIYTVEHIFQIIDAGDTIVICNKSCVSNSKCSFYNT